MQSWILVQIVFDVLLSALLVFLIIRERRSHSAEPAENVSPKEIQDLIETLRDLVARSEEAAEHLHKTLEDQQVRVRSLLARVRSVEKGTAAPAPVDERDERTAREEPPSAERRDADRRQAQWDEITRLFDDGLSREEIVKRLRVSRGVVDLVLGLRRRR